MNPSQKMSIIAPMVMISWAITAMAHWKMIITFGSLFLAFFCSASVGVIFGLWPAQQAAALDPVRALRYE